MRGALAIALGSLLLVTSCGAREQRPARDGTALHRYGIAVRAPEGWQATITHGALRAANFSLPPTRGRPLGDGELLVQLFETDREADSPATELALYQPLAKVPTLAVHDFHPPEPRTEQVGSLAGRTFSVAGRPFVLLAESGTRAPPPERLAQLDELLRSISIEPGDFYPGRVDPPRFTAREGWHVGDSGPRPVGAGDNFVSAWASTIRFVDPWNAGHPTETLRKLGRDGTVIWIGLTRTNRFAPGGRELAPPLRLSGFERRAAWEGQVRDLPEYLVLARVDDEYEVEARVFFGRPDPTREMEDEADAMLSGLRLPGWPRWD